MKQGRRTKLLVSSFAALSLLLAACGGGNDTAAPAPAPAPGDTAPVQVDPSADYPNRSITWVVAFAPGGAMDIEVRRIQSALEAELGVRVNVLYLPGAGGAVGWSQVKDADKDGYTVTGLALPHIAVQPLMPDAPGYVTSDLDPLVWKAISGGALIVREDSPFQTLEDLLDAARANPGSITLGGVDTYSASDLLFAQIEEVTGVSMTYVPIAGGGGPLTRAILGGEVDGGLLGSSHATTTEGMRALAVAGDQRFEAIADVPTFSELGYEGITVFYVWGVGMPAGVDERIKKKFADAVVAAVRNSGAEADLVRDGYLVALLANEDADTFANAQVEAFAALAPRLRDLHG